MLYPEPMRCPSPTPCRSFPTAASLVLAWLTLAASAAGCRPGSRVSAKGALDVEAISLLGRPLEPPVLADELRHERDQLLDEARAEYERHPDDVEALIWLGRRTAYLGRYREAVAIFTRGIDRYPDDPRLYRHRGHRYITLRRFDLAVADLERGCRLVAGRPDEVEPDGLPNARNIPTSTLQSNLWYHLGLAHYLQGDFGRAERAYRRCLERSGNPDMLCATTHWLTMTLRRLGRPAEADELLSPIDANLDVIENGAYHRLLLFYKGQGSEDELLADSGAADSIDFATIGYGVGVWLLDHGSKDLALELLRRVVEGGQWAAFGHIAAEAELARAEARD